LVSTIGCGNTSSNNEEVFIFCAAGIKPAIDEAAGLFEQETGIKVSINYGGGGEVLSSMVLARTGDIYIAPEQQFMDTAIAKGAINADATISVLAYMIPVIGVQKGNPLNIQSFADLAKPGVDIALCNPGTTALGELVPQMLQKAGLYDAVMQNVVTNVPQVTSVITNLKMHQVDAGIIWHNFGTTNSNDLDIIWIPKEYVTGIGEIQAAVSSYSQSVTTAQAFIDFLMSPEGQDVFKKNGYITDVEEANEYWQ
jgi:molybdate transport system substrate-binding protein